MNCMGRGLEAWERGDEVPGTAGSSVVMEQRI